MVGMMELNVVSMTKNIIVLTPRWDIWRMNAKKTMSASVMPSVISNRTHIFSLDELRSVYF